MGIGVPAGQAPAGLALTGIGTLLLQQSRTSVPALAQVQRQYLELHVEVSLCLARVLVVAAGETVRMAPPLILTIARGGAGG